MLALLFVIACAPSTPVEDDTGAPCDPTTPSIALPSFTDPLAIERFEVAPTAIDPASDNYPVAHHRLAVATDASVAPRDQLFVFLPGTANLPDAFDHLAEIAVRAGYPVIVLAWDNEIYPILECHALHAGDIAGQAACRTAAFEEKAYGVDVSEVVDVSEADSVVGRLTRLLSWLDDNHPSTGAARFLDGDQPRWSSIALGGFSQGAVMTSYLSRDHEVARAVLLGGACDGERIAGESVLADWCYDARATPVERTWALRHTQDETLQDVASLEAFGLAELGDYADAGVESPAYCSGTHLLESNLASAGDGTRYHLSVAHDEFMPLDADGVPLLAEDYYGMLTLP